MPVLSNGRVVGISDRRAQHHAAQLNLRVTQKTSLSDIHKLIDVVYSKYNNIDTAKDEPVFSGFTLSDKSGFEGWCNKDIASFFKWINTPENKKYIENTRSKLVSVRRDAKVITDELPSRLYLIIERMIQKCELISAQSDQWTGTINNFINQGLTKDEIEFTDIINWLNMKIGKVYKKDILKYLKIKKQQIKIGYEVQVCIEGIKYVPCSWMIKKGIDQWLMRKKLYSIVRYVSPQLNYRIVMHKFYSMDNCKHKFNVGWSILDADDQWIGDKNGVVVFTSKAEAISVSERNSRRNHHVSLINKRVTHHDFETLINGDKYEELLVLMPYIHDNFYSTHFLSRNIIAHIRTNHRQDESGKNILFIEEIQSDWHQSGRRDGYTDNVKVINNTPDVSLKKEWYKLALKIIIFKAIEEGCDAVAWAGGSIHEERYCRVLHGLRLFYDRQIPACLNGLIKHWQGKITTLSIKSGRQNLVSNLIKGDSQYYIMNVSNGARTKARYSKEAALQYIKIQSREVLYNVDAIIITNEMKSYIKKNGLPLMGSTHIVYSKEENRKFSDIKNTKEINISNTKSEVFSSKPAQQTLWDENEHVMAEESKPIDKVLVNACSMIKALIDEALEDLEYSSKTGYMSDTKSSVFAIQRYVDKLNIDENIKHEIKDFADRAWSSVSSSNEAYRRIIDTNYVLITLNEYIKQYS